MLYRGVCAYNTGTPTYMKPTTRYKIKHFDVKASLTFV